MSEISAIEAGNLEAQNTPVEPPASPVEPVAQPVTPEELFEVKVNGRPMKVSLDELRNGYSRQQDYTKKTMDLANERNSWVEKERQYQEQFQQVQNFLSDPRVQAALRNMQAGITDPNQPPTTEQLLQLQRQEAERQQAMLDARMSQMSQELEVRTLAAHYATEIDSTLKQLMDKHPVLQDIDGIEELLRKDVASREPANLQEAKAIFAEAAQARADRIMSRFQTQQKQEAIERAKLVKGGIETGGSSPQLAQPERKFKLGSNELFQAALEDLTRSSR